jgi:ATP-dependent Lon protease
MSARAKSDLPSNERPVPIHRAAAAATDERTMDKLPDDAMILLPARDLVLFPGMVLPIVVGRGGSIAAAQEAARNERPLGVVLQRSAEVEDPGPAETCTGSAPSPTSCAT